MVITGEDGDADDPGGNRPPKRKELTPDAVQEKEKVAKQYESLTNQHPSVLKASDLRITEGSPVKSLNIVQKLEMAGISGSGAKIDLDTVYKLVMDLSLRVASVEDQLIKKDEEIFNLRRDNASLEKQVKDMRLEKSGSIVPDEGDSQFLEVLRKEIPSLSEHVAKNESEINKLKVTVGDLEQKNEAKDDEVIDMDNTEQAHTVKQIQEAQEENKRYFIRESRKLHLEGEHRDQYTMRETIRVTGVPFKRGENTTDIICRIAHSIGVYICPDDISVSHRTGKHHTGRHRAIICKFTRRETKYKILQNRKLARNITSDDDGNPVTIFIDEKLTPMRANVCRLLRNEKVQHHTKDGKIFITNTGSNQLTVLDTVEDWVKWDRSDKTKMDLGVFPKI